MFGSTMLDVAIGMIFLYSVFSMVATKINDIIASWLRWRSKTMQENLRSVLGDPELANKVWQHSLVQGVVGKGRATPSNIPPNTLALALFDAIVPGSGTPRALDTVRAKITELPADSTRQSLLTLIDSAEGNLDKAIFQVTDWFDSSMERVSALYKQRMQTLSLAVALIVTLVFNGDTLAIANSLWQEPTLRAAVAGAATRGVPETTAASAAQTGAAVQQVVASISELNLPIGWVTLPTTIGGWVMKILGLALTTLAVSLGAPFWYDLLKNLSALRQQQADVKKQT